MGHFYNVYYLSICQTSNAGKFLVVCVQFLISALIFAPCFSAIGRAWSQISHLFNFWRANRFKKRLEPRKPGYPGKNNMANQENIVSWSILLHGFAGISYFVDQKTRKLQRNKSQKRNGYKVLRNVNHCVLRTLALIVSAHPYCTRKFNCNIFGLTDTVTLLCNEARFFQI